MEKAHLNTMKTDFIKSPFWDLIGLEIKRIQKGYAELYLPFKSSLINRGNTVHGGVYATVLDTTMAMAGESLGFDKVVTVQMNIQFLKPVTEGTIYSEARVIHQNRNTLFIKGKLTDEENNLIAYSTGSFKVG